MAAFNRGLDEAFVEALNEQYEKKEAGWWSQFVDDTELFLAIRDNAVHVYYQGCRLIEVAWNGEIVANTHYKYLLRPKVKPKYVDVVDGEPRIGNASAYLAKKLNVGELKKTARRYVGEEKKGVHEILRKNPHVLDVEIAIKGESSRIDFAALQQGEADQTHVVFYEAKHFDNPELRRRGKPKVVEQIDKYRDLLDHDQYRKNIAESYRRVAENLCALKGVQCHHRERYERYSLLKNDCFIIEREPRLVVFGFDKDQKCGSIWDKHKARLECLLGKKRLILSGNAAGVKIPT